MLNSKNHEIIDFVKFWFKFEPHDYQQDFLLDCVKKKRVVGLWSRQSGKSTTIANFVNYRALTIPSLSILIVAPTQRQSSELFNKIREIVNRNTELKDYTRMCTQTEIRFWNESRIIALPCGPDGSTIRGFTADILILEEAQDIKNEIVNQVLLPMISSKENGQVIKIGTPKGKNHFYDSVHRADNYVVHKINWEVAIKAKQYALDTIMDIKESVTELEWQTEYECEFIEDYDSYFNYELINSCISEHKVIPNGVW